MPARIKRTGRSSVSKRRLASLIEEATVDCYNESEAVTGFLTMIDNHLEVPFATAVLGADVKVTGIELTEREEIIAVCVRGKQRQRVPICQLPLSSPPPSGAEWIEAYRKWAAGG